MNGNYGLARVNDGDECQVISRTRYNQQDWDSGDGLVEGRRLLADSLRLGIIRFNDDNKAEFAADPDVTIGTVEGLEEVKQLMKTVEQGTAVDPFSPQQNVW